MARVAFYAECHFAGCDMDPIVEELDPETDNLEGMAEGYAIQWAGVTGWYEILNEEEDDDD